MWRIWGRRVSDAGTGYELLAITAVVLGGTDIMGGTRQHLGNAAGVVCDRDLAEWTSRLGVSRGTGRHSDQRDSGGDHRHRPLRSRRAATPARRRHDGRRNEEFATGGSERGVILAGSLIVAGSNWWLVQSVRGKRQRPRPAPHSARYAGRHAESQGRSLFRELPRGRGRGREGTGRGHDLGRPHRSRPGEAERNRRSAGSRAAWIRSPCRW